MVQKYLFSPFMVYLDQNEKFEEYTNFNGKYFITKEIEPNKWVYFSLDSYLNNETKSLRDVCQMIVNGDKESLISSTLTYGEDYMLSESFEGFFDVETTTTTTYKPTTTTTTQNPNYYQNGGIMDDESEIMLLSSDDEDEEEYETSTYDYLPNLLVNGSLNTTYFNETKTKSSNNVSVSSYKSLNDYVNNNKFTDEQLKSLCSTFCGLILDTSNISTYTTSDEIWQMVLNYYKNEGSDDIIEKFSLLSSLYTTSSSSTCGCTSVSSCSGTITSSSSTTSCDCVSIYKDYITSTLKTMLGDTTFYKNWFQDLIEGESDDVTYNMELCENLIKLLNEFMNEGYDLSFSTSDLNSCPSVTNQESECNYKKIENYIKVLEWVENGEIDENKNKIKSYGQSFGELLPYLMF